MSVVGKKFITILLATVLYNYKVLQMRRMFAEMTSDLILI